MTDRIWSVWGVAPPSRVRVMVSLSYAAVGAQVMVKVLPAGTTVSLVGAEMTSKLAV